jgi:KTSC domain
MERTRAFNSNSGNILSYGWEPNPDTLEVEFGGRKDKAAAIYQYAGVPQQKWLALLAAPSAGSYLRNDIIPHYRVRKL